MRRLSDIRIEVDDRPGPRRAKPRPANRPATRQTLARRRWVPFWWKKVRRVAMVVAAGTAAVALPLWLTHTASGHQLVEHLRGEAVALSGRAGFRVEDIYVEGRNRTPRDELLAALKVQRGDPIFGVDLTAARQRLAEISWVKTAVIERRLPSQVHLLITERAPIVLWQNQGHYYLVDAEGQVVGDEIEEYAGLPLTVGEGAPDHAAELVQLLAAEPVLAKRVKAAQWVGERRWNMTLDRTDGGVEVRLPEDDPTAAWHELAKLDREQSLLERQVSVVDMRMPDRLVLRGIGRGPDAVSGTTSKRKAQPGKDA